MTVVNPFDALDAKSTPDELAALDVFRKKNNPGFFATFATGRKAGYFQDTLVGHSMANNEQQGAAINAAKDDSNLPQWEDMNPLQKGAYAGGRLWGNIMSPENFIPVGVGAKALDYAGIKTAGWGAKFFAGAVDAAVINAPTDAALQVMDIQAGKRDQFSVIDLVASTALGSVIGGAGSVLHHAFSSMLGDAPVPKVYQDAKPAPPEPIAPIVVPEPLAYATNRAANP
jgi:hypothetical protein